MLCCLYIGPQMITLKRKCRPLWRTRGGCFLSVQELLEFFLGTCFSAGVGIKFNIKSKEAGVCINLQMCASHLCIARLHIYVYIMPIYTGECTKDGDKNQRKNILFFYTQFYVLFYLPVSLKL